MSGTYIIAPALSLILGCYTAYIYTPPMFATVLMIAGTFTALFLMRRKRKAVTVCICILALLIGIIRTAPARSVYENLSVNKITGGVYGEVYVEGVVTGDIESRDSYDRYVVEVAKIGGEKVQEKFSVLVYEPYPTECIPGENISFSGNLREPENFLGSGGRIFDYKKHLNQQGIYATAFIKESSCRGEAGRHAFFAGARNFFVSAMKKVLPAQESSLLSGLILGLRGSLSPDLLDAFRVTGLIHIIVLSGYNVTLVAETVRRLFLWAPRKVSFVISLAVIALFVLLAGAQTAAVRAGSMATIALIARATNREYDGVRALVLVALLMTLVNPSQVLFSISFHLSFLATLGLLLFSPVCERIFRFLPQKFEMRGIVSATVATQVTLLPYLAYAIGEVSVIGIPANIVILPIIPIAMLFGFIVTVLAAVVPFAAFIIAPAAYLPLHAIIFLAEVSARIPGATVRLPEIPALLMLLFTGLIVFIGYEYTKHRKEKALE